MNPGQLILAMADEVTTRGGRIGTSCKVEEINQKEDGLEVSVNCGGETYT